jgi:hypothetical protein
MTSHGTGHKALAAWTKELFHGVRNYFTRTFGSKSQLIWLKDRTQIIHNRLAGQFAYDAAQN